MNNDQWNYANPTFRLSQAARTLAYTPPARREPFLFLTIRLEPALRWRHRCWLHAHAAGEFRGVRPRCVDFKDLEDISAGYLMGTWQTSRFRAVGGLRYENVDATAKTFRRLVAPVPDVFIPIDVPTGYHNPRPP